MTESMAAEWEKWIEQEKTNREAIEKQLSDLSAFNDSPSEFRYREFWDLARQISETIKTVSPLPDNDRDNLQRDFDRICRETKKRQVNERETRMANSKQNRDAILGKVGEAISIAEAGTEDIQSLNKAQALLSEALGWLKNGGGKSNAADDNSEATPVSNDLMRDDRQICWDKWREANEMVFGHRQAIWEQNYDQVDPGAKAALDEANDGDPFRSLEKVKEAQKKLKETPLSKTQREDIRNILNSAWEIAIEKVNTIREEKKRNYEEWLERMEGQLNDWTSQFEQNTQTITNLQAEIEVIKEQIQSARAKEVGDKLRDQIAEKRQEIRGLERTNSQLEEKIQAIKNKLDG